MARKSAVLSILAFFIIIPSLLPAQMPDWKYFRDREGNSYYYDRASKIRIPETEGLEYIPVSPAGVDFYLNTGIELINEGKYSEGLFYIKSIRILPDINFRVKKARAEAAKWMNYLYKKHGTRYESYDHESAVLIIKENSNYQVINEKLYYKLIFPHRPYLLKKNWKYYDKGYGLKIGAKIDEKGTYEGFDYITGVESRISEGSIETVDDAYVSWRLEMGKDAMERKELLRRPDRIINEIRYPDNAPFAGIEGIYKNGRIIHIARIVFHESVRDRVYPFAKDILENMILVNHP